MISTSADDTIALHYQPIVQNGGRVVGLEALMRWHHRQRSAVSPEAFVPIFEKSDLILPLSRWALTRACADAAEWDRPLTVAVNLSPIQFLEDDVPDLVHAALSETGLAARRLELEVTEAALLADPAGTRTALVALDAEGVAITLDNFGTGSASASCLDGFPFSKIKIDTGFVAGIETSASARRIIHMIIELGHSLNLVVAAQGVETASQLNYLADHGCDLLQGFFLGRPSALADIAMLTRIRGVGPPPTSAYVGLGPSWPFSYPGA